MAAGYSEDKRGHSLSSSGVKNFLSEESVN
jgi:hypothetical protein